jgi:hypothetical protein
MKYGMTGDSQRKREHKGLSIVLARGRHNGQSSVMPFQAKRMSFAKRDSAWGLAFQPAD